MTRFMSGTSLGVIGGILILCGFPIAGSVLIAIGFYCVSTV